MNTEYDVTNDSPRANQVLQNLPPNGKLWQLCVRRSDRRILVNPDHEAAAQIAAAKLCQQHGLRLIDVWTESGEDYYAGYYKMFFIVTVPNTRH
jgi:hypothetical protein